MKSLKKITLKIVSLIVVFNLVFLGPVSLTLAQEASPDPGATAENTDTGSSSDNTASSETTETTDATNTNDATVDNTVTGGSDSGTNDATNNTGDATITTSDAATSSSTDNQVNQNAILPSPSPSYAPMSWTTWTGDGDWTSWASNSQTGSSSTNTASTDSSQTTSLTNTNIATIDNTTDTFSTTGGNTASDNTGNASINTGEATNISSIQNLANLNFWTGEGDWTNLWNGEALNWRTGSGSTNASSAELDRILSVLNENGVDVDNLINSFSSSGANTASDNTGNASITTGDASMLATIFNLANTNIFGTDAINILYQDIYGAYNGNINLAGANSFNLPAGRQGLPQGSAGNLSSENNTTGFNSDNLSEVIGTLTVDILNNNTGDLINNLDLEAISGNNTASDNTGNSYIETGDADVIANLINFLNTNVFTNEFYLGVINVYGSWNGNLVLPEYNEGNSSYANLAASATNEFTGSSSSNDSTTSLTDATTIENNNFGTVNNNFNATAETGGNSASDNTLNGTIRTGSANAEGNLANFTNTNVVSDSPWWLILVNNLGTWIPILVPSYSGSTQLVLDLDDLGSGDNYSGTEVPLYAGNEFTGSSSDNSALASQTNETNIANNNDGSITNNVDTLALTGGNEANRNTGHGTVITGDANIWINALNFLNTNIIAPSFMLTVINIFGNWTGDILNAGDEPSAPSENNSQPAQGGTAGQPSDNSSNSSSGSTSGSSGGSSNPSNTTSNPPPSGSSQQGGVKTQLSYIGNTSYDGGSGQILSFFAASENPADEQTSNQANTLTNSLQAWMIALALIPLLLAVSYWQRKRLLNLLQKNYINPSPFAK